VVLTGDTSGVDFPVDYIYLHRAIRGWSSDRRTAHVH